MSKKKLLLDYYSKLNIEYNEESCYYDNMCKIFNLNIKEICDILFEFNYKQHKTEFIFSSTYYYYKDSNKNNVILNICIDGYWSIKIYNFFNDNINYFENSFEDVNHTLF